MNDYIDGTVDFIFGGGTAVFNTCDIYEKRNVQAPHDTQHCLLHHVVDVGVSVQCSPDNVVNQRQILAEQLRQRFPIAGARRLDQR